MAPEAAGFAFPPAARAIRVRAGVADDDYNVNIWKRALEEVGVEPTGANGSGRLPGHVDPGFTMRLYAHLMPAAEGRARAAVDAALGSSAGQMRPRATDEAQVPLVGGRGALDVVVEVELVGVGAQTDL
jgi:hypothetical protein